MSKKIYKVVTVDSLRTHRTSYIASGELQRTYSTEEETTAIPGSPGLFAFAEESYARDLIADQDDCELWLAEGTNVRYPSDEKEGDYPDGTVLCDSMRLLERIA